MAAEKGCPAAGADGRAEAGAGRNPLLLGQATGVYTAPGAGRKSTSGRRRGRVRRPKRGAGASRPAAAILAEAGATGLGEPLRRTALGRAGFATTRPVSLFGARTGDGAGDIPPLVPCRSASPSWGWPWGGRKGARRSRDKAPEGPTWARRLRLLPLLLAPLASPPLLVPGAQCQHKAGFPDEGGARQAVSLLCKTRWDLAVPGKGVLCGGKSSYGTAPCPVTGPVPSRPGPHRIRRAAGEAAGLQPPSALSGQALQCPGRRQDPGSAGAGPPSIHPFIHPYHLI